MCVTKFWTRTIPVALLGVICTVAEVGAAEKVDMDQQIAVVLGVGNEGAGNERAQTALRHLENASGGALVKILEGMDGASPLSLNWLRAAADTIVDRERQAGRELPLSNLGEFLLDVRHHPRARRFAYEVIARESPQAAEQILPGMLNDPSTELRRDAVQRLLDSAKGLEESGKNADASLLFRQALGAARDVDQIDALAGGLRRLGGEVDLPLHFGFLMHWQVIGPFDNTDRRGFETVYPPEEALDLGASYPGKETSAKWQPLATSDPYGMLDINQAFGAKKEVTAYAYTEFEADEARSVELRLGCKNAWKIWMNGEYIFGRDEYHRGMSIDQYKLPVQLQKGKNTILVKVCQNEQVEDWTVEWQFQLRVCDATGTAVLASNRQPTPQEESVSRR